MFHTIFENMCEVHEFFPKEQFQPGQTMVVLGRSGSGTSTFVFDICKKLRDQVDMFTVINDRIDHKYPPNTCIYSEWKEDRMDRFLRTHQEAWRQYVHHKKSNKDETQWEPKQGMNTCLIIRNAGTSPNIRDSKLFRKMILNNRCKYNLRIILVCQCEMYLPSIIRGNAKWVFCTKGNNEERLHDAYFSKFEKLKHFRKLFQKITFNWTLLGKFIDNTYYWYKVNLTTKRKNEEDEFQIIKKSR